MTTPLPAERPAPLPAAEAPLRASLPANAAPAARGGTVLLVDADPLLAKLIEEWLADEGLQVQAAPPLAAQPAPGAAGTDACRLVIVDLPDPRRTGVDSIRTVASRHPGMPIIALSPILFASPECCGAVARSLGVDCALAKPVSRETLVAAVRKLLSSRC